MIINREQLHKLAKLSRLEIAQENEDKLLQDLNKVIGWVDTLQTIDTTGVEPLVNMSHEINALREDEIKPTLTRDEALANAPKHNERYFIVPKVID